MNKAEFAAALTAVALLSGCASSDPKRAEGDFEYLEDAQQHTLAIPEGLQRPIAMDELKIPQPSDASQPTGEALDIRPPAQIIPLAEGMLAAETSERVEVTIEASSYSEHLRDEIWQYLWESLIERGINGEYWDKQSGLIVTDWFDTEIVAEKGTFDWLTRWFRSKAPTQTVRQRYSLSFDVPAHGRTARLKVAQLGFQLLSDGEQLDYQQPVAERRRAATDFMNETLAYYDYKQRLAKAKLQSARSRGIQLALGKDNNGLPSFIADADFEYVWSRIPLVFAELGMQIKDRHKSSGTYEVNYTGTESFWASIWGDDNRLDIDYGIYTVLLGVKGQATTITILTEKNQPIREAYVPKVFEVFSELMADIENITATPVEANSLEDNCDARGSEQDRRQCEYEKDKKREKQR